MIGTENNLILFTLLEGIANSVINIECSRLDVVSNI